MMSNATEVVALPVSGMTCGRCVAHVRQALESVPGVRSADIDLAAGRADVSLEPGRVSRDRLKAAVEAAGYSVPDGPAAAGSPVPHVVSITPLLPAPPPRAVRHGRGLLFIESPRSFSQL